jgi:hypothetical protein
MDTLAFGYILPTTGWIRDFNPLETCAARRTREKGKAADTAFPFSIYLLSEVFYRTESIIALIFSGFAFIGTSHPEPSINPPFLPI